eukprot:CAMPEP_0113382792 /NCGR_PEP_ID=MMETSP0013_2-20120614/6029_1 /TAXON_ID=2843 ORGANISM="Skeletonema costatum, Strain 1716" /NCGR_SAMPLE_ID=MMETSP0013_2 /ASSEMBLY_ACC=CAM_ASM_000158 /LENGTH=903 /DNA_ID=CAMNT_0000265319 /DNA_START=123 /DNA_END=2834 /DNA_ORIENTATION=- /assembly_acc=CAM_ASM_000158
MNIDTENQRQLLLLPDDPPPTATAAEDLTSNFALSTPQDRAAEDDASVLEEGPLPASIGDDDYYDEKISFCDDDEDGIDICNEIKLVAEVEDRQQLRPDGSSVGDNNLVITREAKTLMSGGGGTGTAAADSAAQNGALNPQDHHGPPEDATTPQDDDRVKLCDCEEGGSLLTPVPMLDDDYDNNNNRDNDSSNNNELQSLCRQPSSNASKSCESDTQQCLCEDTFSFLIYSHVRSRAFFLATLVFLFQIAIYVVLAIDIINASDPNNPLKFPVNVEGAVRAAEFLAIVVAIITQDDLRKAVNLLRDGFDQNLANAHEGATKKKWILSIVLRGSEGFFGLFLTFLLIMQTETVIELLLNFLAMGFVGQLDDVVFVLTREGFLGKALQKDAKKLSCTFYNVSHLSTESKTASFATFAYFGVFFVAFFAAWVTIFWKQNNGKYLCKHIFGEFSDEVVPILETFTGLFSRHTKSYGKRLSYINYQGDGNWVAVLAYCLEQKRWTLSLADSPPYYYNNGDGDIQYHVNPCTHWIAASDESTAFDVLETANSQWVVRTPEMGIVPLSRHFLSCRVMLIDDFCGKRGLSSIFDSHEGDEVNLSNVYSCKCKKKGYFVECTYSERCQRLEIGPGDMGFEKTSGTSSYFASTFYLLKGAEAYNRPVYTSLPVLFNNQDEDVNFGENQVRLGENQTLSNVTDIDIIVFTGARWILSYKSLFPGLKNVSDESEMAEYFSKFHGHFTEYDTLYVSEPVYASDTLYADYDIKFVPFPSNLSWHYSSALQSTFGQQLQPDLEKISVEATFTCAECSSSISDKSKSCSCKIVPFFSYRTGDWVLGILLYIVLPVCGVLLCCCACRKCCTCRKNAINTNDAENEEAQLVENEEIDVEKDVTPAAEDEDELDGHSSMTRA